MSKLKISLIFPIILISVFGFLFSFSVQEARAEIATFYSTMDGRVGHSTGNPGVSWTTLRNAAGNYAGESGGNISDCFYTASGTSSNLWIQINRGIFVFDTSSLPDGAVISAATLSIMFADKYDGLSITPNVSVYTSAPASNTALEGGDYDSLGSTAVSPTTISYSNINISDVYTDFSLNSSGIAAISTTGFSRFGCRNASYDASGTVPTWKAASKYTEISYWTEEQYAGTKNPKLVVIYTVPVTVPTVTTDIATVGATEIQNDQAIFRGTVTNNGGATITNIRFMWGITSGSYPNSSGDISCSGCSTFQWTKTGMTAGTTYYYKAQASNSAGWSDLNDPNNQEKRVVIYEDSGGQQSFITCHCSTTTVGGCCDGCNYCPAGKLFNGTSCVDATATIKCASTVNKCTAGNCSGEKRYPECQSGGNCDSTATTYYTSESVLASNGYVLKSDCSQAALSCTDYCGSVGNYCTEDRYKGEFRQACGGTGSCNGSTIGCNGIQDCGATSNACSSKCQQDYQHTCSAGVCGTYHTYTTASQGERCEAGNLINTGSCATSTYNARSTDKCDKKRDLYRCNGTGYNDSDCNYDVGDDWTYVSVSKIANSAGQEVDASSADNTGNCHDCTDGTCSGTYHWGECDGSGNAGPCSTYNQSGTAYAQEGYTLTAACGTAGTAYCLTDQCRDDATWHHVCDKRCAADHSCNYWIDGTCEDHCINGVRDCDETDIDEGGSCPIVCDCTSNNPGGCCDGCNFCPAGLVNNGAGVCVTPDAVYHCNSWEDCDDGDCSATRRWYGCTGVDETCSATSYQAETVIAAEGYVLKADCSEAVLSCTDYCGLAGNYCGTNRYQYQNRQSCGGTGSCNGAVVGCYLQDCGATSNSCSSKCQKDYQYTCSAGTCGIYHTYTTASQGYYCSGGNLINTGSCAFSAYNARSVDKCDKKRDLYRCDGLGFNDSNCSYDVGDEWAYVSANKIANSSGQEVEASSADNTGTCHVCTAGTCSGTYHWGECDGSGNAGPCASYNQSEPAYAQEGYTLTANCETNGISYCLTDQCRDDVTWHHRCNKRCDAAHSCNYWVDATCLDHCTNGIQDCDETDIDCGGSCNLCDTTTPTTNIRIFDSANNDVTETKEWLRADTYTVKLIANDDIELKNGEYYILAFDPDETIVPLTTESFSGTEGIILIEVDAGKLKDKPDTDYWREGLGKYLIWFNAKDQADNEPVTPASRGLNFDFTPPETEIR